MLKVNNLYKSYRKEQVLKDISLQVNRGKCWEL